MGNEKFKIVVKTFHGLEKSLAAELKAIGAGNIALQRRAVTCEGNNKTLYKINFYSRTALKVLKPVLEFQARNDVELYDGIYHFDWSQYFDVKDTLAIDTVVLSSYFKHSKYVAYKVKDAIADQFRKKTGKRPSINITSPSIRLNAHIANDLCTVSLDSSGESLHKRGYRVNGGAAPLNEILAAGLVLLSEWDAASHFIDPMCGSGTIAIEAALHAYKIPPGIFRDEFGFEKWKDFDESLYDEIVNEEYDETAFNHQICASDISPEAVKVALQNIKNASLAKKIDLKILPFDKTLPPDGKGIIIMNPPYGERMQPGGPTFYKSIGDHLKNHYKGYEAWVLLPKSDSNINIGLHPVKKITLFNGAIECSFQKYLIYEGSMKTSKQFKPKKNMVSQRNS